MKWNKHTKVFTMSLIFLVTFALGFGSSNAEAADLKLAKVSLTNVYKGSLRVKAVSEEVKQMRSDSTKKITALAADLEQIEKKLKEDENKLSKEEKEKLEAEGQSKMKELQGEQQSVRANMAMKQQVLQDGFSNQIKVIVENIAKKEGYVAVLATEALVYSNNLPDLTDLVIKELDAMPSGDKK